MKKLRMVTLILLLFITSCVRLPGETPSQEVMKKRAEKRDVVLWIVITGLFTATFITFHSNGNQN